MKGTHRTVLASVAIIAAMAGLVAVSVPLYRLFCQVTGYQGTPRIVASDTASVNNQTVTIRFDTNVMPGLPWGFKPERNSMKVRLGETNMAIFNAVNKSSDTVVGTAVFNVTPLLAASYVDKIQCFCFTQQELKPGEAADMPVTFFIDPKIAADPETKDIHTITLSYSFYKARNQDVGNAAQLTPGKVLPTTTTDRKEGKS